MMQPQWSIDEIVKVNGLTLKVLASTERGWYLLTDESIIESVYEWEPGQGLIQELEDDEE